MDINQANEICQKFANDHKLIFEPEGECGFGRECVGFLARNGSWVNYHPCEYKNYKEIAGFTDEGVDPPEGVEAYHKHDCMCVLGRGDEAIIQLARWAQKINETGRARVITFETGAEGIQALLSGVTGYAITTDKPC